MSYDSLRKRMMRCYMLGYITTKYNEYNSLQNSPEFESYLDSKKIGAIEKLVEYKIPRKIASIVIKITPPIERTVSVIICIWMFVVSSFNFLFVKRRKYQHLIFFPKLNARETGVTNLYKSAGYDIKDYVAIVIPGQYSKFYKIQQVSVYSGVSYLQLFLSLLYAIRISIFIVNKYGKEDMLFRSYSSYPFFLCFFFINNLDSTNELLFYNHYDRWMYLFGYSSLRKTYVQHGKLGYDCIKRIKCDVAYYISQSQKEVLEHTLFDNKPEARFRKLFEFSAMSKLKTNSNIHLLIVCLSVYAERHERIVKQLYNRNVNIYLKPHPQDNLDIYISFQKKYPNIVILGMFDYPKVDYVISYDSTLADEYDMHDIPVLKYEDSNFKDCFEEWFGKLEE